jgi:ABC-2 type transport system permease protein
VFSLPLSFALLIQEIFLSKDLPFLLTLPIPVRSVLAAKIIVAALPGLGMYELFYIPYLSALGQAYGFSPLYYLAMLIPPAAIFLAASALSSLFVLLAVRYFSTRALLAGLFGLLILAAALIILFDPPESHSLRDYLDPDQLSVFLNLAVQANLPFSPITWAGRGLLALGENQIWWGIGQMIPLLLLCGLLFFSPLSVGERLYLEGYGRLAGSRNKRDSIWRSRFYVFIRIADWAAARIPPIVRAILYKDLRFFFRDLQYMSFLLVPLFAGGMILLSALRVQTGETYTPADADPFELPAQLERALEMTILFAPLLFTYFICLFSSAYILIPLISLEGRSLWILRTAPVAPSQFIVAKYLAGLFVLLPFYALLTLFLQLILGSPYSDFMPVLYSQVTQVFTLASLAALYLYLGSIQARFDWAHPGKLMNFSALLCSLVGGVQVGFSSLLFYALPAGLYAFNLHPAVALLIGLVVGAAFCYGMIRWQLRRAGARIDRFFSAE